MITDRIGSQSVLSSFLIGNYFYKLYWGRCGALMVKMLDSRASAPVSCHNQEDCVVFLGKKLYCQGASFQSRCINGYRQIYCRGEPYIACISFTVTNKITREGTTSRNIYGKLPVKILRVRSIAAPVRICQTFINNNCPN